MPSCILQTEIILFTLNLSLKISSLSLYSRTLLLDLLIVENQNLTYTLNLFSPPYVPGLCSNLLPPRN